MPWPLLLHPARCAIHGLGIVRGRSKPPFNMATGQIERFARAHSCLKLSRSLIQMPDLGLLGPKVDNTCHLLANIARCRGRLSPPIFLRVRVLVHLSEPLHCGPHGRGARGSQPCHMESPTILPSLHGKGRLTCGMDIPYIPSRFGTGDLAPTRPFCFVLSIALAINNFCLSNSHCFATPFTRYITSSVGR